MLLKYLFGDDIFISYTRADAITYAAGLASQLTARDFSCYLDQWLSTASPELPRPLKRALSRSALLVLVGSDGVLHSEAVRLEVAQFRKTGRTIVPIDFGALERVPWFELIAGLARTPESPAALQTGEPSAAVVARIEKSFQFVRRNQRARRSFAIAGTLLALLAVTSSYTAYQARESAREATKQTELAERNRKTAEDQTALAEQNRKDAVAQTELAEMRAAEAQKQADRASEQERFATSRALAASASAQILVDPAKSLRLAQDAWRTQPTDEARAALRDALLQSHVRLTVGAHTGSIGASSFNRDGTLLVVASGNTARIIDVRNSHVVSELRGHDKPVRSAAFSPVDDGVIITAAEDTLRVWRWRSKRPPVELRSRTGPAIEVAFSADGRFVVATTGPDTCSDYKNYEGLHSLSEAKVATWQVDVATDNGIVFSGSCLGRGRGSEAAPLGALISDGRFIVYACVDSGERADVSKECGQTRIRDLVDGRLLDPLEGNPRVVDAVISARSGIVVGRVVTDASPGGITVTRAQVWSLTTGAVLGELSQPAEMLALAPDGTMLVTARDREAFVWKLPASDKSRAGAQPLSPALVLGSHTGRVRGIAISRDGRFIFTAADDRTVRMWDTATGKTAAILRGHGGPVDSVAISPDGSMVATASADGTARVWGAGPSRPVVELTWTEDEIESASFGSDGRVIAISGGNRVRAWTPGGGEQMHAELPGTIRAISRDATTALITRPDTRAWLYTASGQQRLRLNGTRGWFRDAASAPDGRTVLATNADGSVSVWDLESQSTLRTLPGVATNDGALSVSADRQRIVTTHDPIVVRDTRTGDVISSIPERAPGARISPNGRVVVTFGDGNPEIAARLWTADTGAKLLDLKDDEKAVAAEFGHRQSVYQVAFSPDGRRIVTVDPYAALVWAVVLPDEGRASAKPVLLNRRAADVAQVTAVVFSPDGRRVITTHANGPALLWDATTGQRLHILRAHERDAVAAAAFNGDARLIATASLDGVVRLWNPETGQPVREMKAPARDLAHAVFSRDSRLLAAGTSGASDETFVWQVDTGRQVLHLQGHRPLFLADSHEVLTLSQSDAVELWRTRGTQVARIEGFSGQVLHADFTGDGESVLTVTGDHAERVWDARSGRRLSVLREHTARINSAAFSADGTRVLTTGTDDVALVWDWRRGRVEKIESEREFRSMRMPPGSRVAATVDVARRDDSPVTSLWRLTSRDAGAKRRAIELAGRLDDFSPDGRQLMTIGDDGAVRLWNAEEGQLISEMRGHEGPVPDAAFSGDGRFIATVGSEDRSARLWNARTATQLSELLGHDGALTGVGFSPNGRLILTRGKTLRVYECVICGADDDLQRAAERSAPLYDE